MDVCPTRPATKRLALEIRAGDDYGWRRRSRVGLKRQVRAYQGERIKESLSPDRDWLNEFGIGAVLFSRHANDSAGAFWRPNLISPQGIGNRE